MKPLIGAAKLMRAAFNRQDLQPVGNELLLRVRSNVRDANALMDLSTLCQINGQPDVALDFQEQALRQRVCYRIQSARSRQPLRVLAIATPGVMMDNMPIDFLLEHFDVQLETLFVGFELGLPDSLPDHDVAVVTICESDANQELLAELAPVLARWPRPVINSPECIADLARDRLAGKLKRVPGQITVQSMRVDVDKMPTYEDLQRLQVFHSDRLRCGRECPWIIRPIGSHAGHGLERIASQEELNGYLQREVAEQYFVAPFIDYRSPDGKFRKYRVALLNQDSFPVHMAISPRWMVHYLNADMLGSAEHRDEERRFMEEYERGFGARHQRALNAIGDVLGLDYVVLDCAETRDGKLLVFEADNGAVVHSMDSQEIFPYKRPAMQRVFDAFYALLAGRGEALPFRAAA